MSRNVDERNTFTVRQRRCDEASFIGCFHKQNLPSRAVDVDHLVSRLGEHVRKAPASRDSSVKSRDIISAAALPAGTAGIAPPTHDRTCRSPGTFVVPPGPPERPGACPASEATRELGGRQRWA